MDPSSTSNKTDDLQEENKDLKDDTAKKQRTESESSDNQALFFLPSTDGSPPKVMTINEVTNVVNNIQNMTLAHEIAINPEFKLQSYEPPENSLEKRIKDIMHKAFWDVLRQQINSKPPSFDHAIQLLIDIKECFPQIIPSTNQRILNHINDILDVKIIRQQAEQGTLDFRSYADFVIQIMAKSCAPVRDEQIQSLSKIDDVVDTFKGILETMTLMKLDMANCLLDFARNDILANSVEYEKQKFEEFLEYYKFGFPATENWLRRHQVNDTNGKKTSNEETIINAYLELMDWNETLDYPEILANDKERLYILSFRAIKLCICVSVIAICSAVPNFPKLVNFYSVLTPQILIILENVNNRNDVIKSMENVWLQVYSMLKKHCEEQSCDFLDQNSEQMLRAQILNTADKEFSVYKLMWKRIQTYVRVVYNINNASLPCSPPGFELVQEELQNYTNAFKRLLKYNFAVYGSYYNKILSN